MTHSEYILTDEEIDQQEHERRQMEEQIARPGASQPMTHAERLLWLAKQEIDCPYLGPNQGKCRDDAIGFVCSECGGTGKVARFPLLWQECPCQNIYVGNMEPSPCLPCREKANRYSVDSDHTMAGHSVFCAIDCECCQGRGWVPVDIEKACWKLSKIEKQLDTLNFTTQYRNGLWEWYNPEIDDTVVAASAEEAQICAAEAWVKAEEKP